MSQNPQNAPVYIDGGKVVTASWANLGPVLDASGSDAIGVWIDLDINDSTDFRVRAVGRLTSSGDDYLLPIRTVSASDVKVEGEYVEFNVDANQKMIVEVSTDQVVPFVQLQIQAGAVGASAGVVVSAYKTEKYGRVR